MTNASTGQLIEAMTDVMTARDHGFRDIVGAAYEFLKSRKCIELSADQIAHTDELDLVHRMVSRVAVCTHADINRVLINWRKDGRKEFGF